MGKVMKKSQQSSPDIFGLMTSIQEQIAALDKKVDLLIGRGSVAPVSQPQPQVIAAAVSVPAPLVPRQETPSRSRQMFQAVCAECKQDCEIPFKPSGERPVYCKECFRRRKTGIAAKPVIEEEPRSEAVELVVDASSSNIVSVPVKEKKRSPAPRKPSPRKKPAVKKGKK
jgi:CxxC-x17-CxxC domain-containing protein